MVFLGLAEKLKNITNFNVKCKEQVMKLQDSLRYLGLNIDRYINCEKIVNSIIEKVNSRLKFLYRNCKNLNSSTRLTLSTALMQCYFDYSCSSCFGGLNKTLKQKLQVAQNKVVRFILNLKPMTRINYSVLSEMNMLKVERKAIEVEPCCFLLGAGVFRLRLFLHAVFCAYTTLPHNLIRNQLPS